MQPKISIIVPVYKVEPYIRKCINSILDQTFTEFELILINDGSPDNCGKICDEYSKSDERIKVVHKKNGGLSSARNAGLEIAQGDYVGFVDSDDWIEPGMYELLYKMCKENKCEIGNCSSIVHYKTKTLVNGGHSLLIHNKSEAMRAMLESELYDEVVWTKLIKREILENIRFKEGIIHEDTDFTYQVINKSNQVCTIGEPLYHYIKRENSTMDLAKKNIRIDSVIIYDEMYKFIDLYYNELRHLVAYKLANNAMRILNLIILNNREREFKEEYYTVTKILNHYYTQIIQLKNLPYKVKFILTLTKMNSSSYKVLIKLSDKKGQIISMKN
ncbi:glycosyltransferase [Salipaludibacillus aurantiacus]|uniref:Glycosyltransferase involved in cell wall bisynthesis n=1 Tax=Salipaludibacillus aurantiacus TaxID=1601833 RepID=A0A1H9UK63_9BACI|nr:glycosyltransferase [Salipaludibacillus aurantiacus]SES09940.1 Glycosyltransferase involved in cell wall bisynthesis [Salipaludibacillus aurantiacus]